MLGIIGTVVSDIFNYQQGIFRKLCNFINEALILIKTK